MKVLKIVIPLAAVLAILGVVGYVSMKGEGEEKAEEYVTYDVTNCVRVAKFAAVKENEIAVKQVIRENVNNPERLIEAVTYVVNDCFYILKARFTAYPEEVYDYELINPFSMPEFLVYVSEVLSGEVNNESNKIY